MQPLRLIPFDAVTLAAVCSELGPFVGGKVQGVRQSGEDRVVFELYRHGQVGQFLMSCHAEYARAHFVTKRPGSAQTPPTFCATLRARLIGARLVKVTMLASDRVLELCFETEEGSYRLMAEIMGKHSNLILVDERLTCVTAAKWVPSGKSSRPILSGGPYSLPPVLRALPDFDSFGDPAAVLADCATPFSKKLSVTVPTEWAPVLVAGFGAYPLSVAELGYSETRKESISFALEQFYDAEVPRREMESVRGGLNSQLSKVVLSREAALNDLYSALDQGNKADGQLRLGELILAYGFAQPPGQSKLQAWDYDGTEVEIRIDPELDVKGNANVYFEKAKRAKARLTHVEEQIERIERDLLIVRDLLAKVEAATRLDEILGIKEKADNGRYLHQVVVAKTKEERPFEGHKIREYLGPGGFQVLLGENSEANDYLTMRMGKGNDIWLHVRGGTSAHVLIRTAGKPERVQPETILYAAKLCVKNSPQKHAKYVAVDWTLKKYVTKPRGAPKGSVTYTREKTVHVGED